MSNPKHGPGFHHITIRSYDFDKTLAFYKEAFGFERSFGWGESGSRAAMLGIGDGNYIEVFEGRQPGEISEGGLVHYALRIADIDDTYQRALKAGASSVMEPKAVDIKGDRVVPVRIAFVKGLDGDVIELFCNDEL